MFYLRFNVVANQKFSATNVLKDATLTIAAFLSAVVLTASAVLMLRSSPFAKSSLDRPNHRSLHIQPTPRIGGVAMAFAVAITIAILRPDGLPASLLVVAACLAVTSLLDDRRNLPVVLRLALQLAAATVAAIVWLYGSEGPVAPAMTNAWLMSPLGAVLMVLAICWMTNLFNFMDGANGLAGGMALIGFGAYAIAAATMPQGQAMTFIAAALSGAALGFLFFNLPAAKIFMGDAGSIPIGFLAATLGIQGTLMGLWTWWFGLLVFSPFIVDATITLIKRLARREKIWVAHREHYYQRLILSGWSHRKTVCSYYLLMLGSAISALAAQNGHLLYPTVTFWVITYSTLLLYLEWRFHQHKKDNTEKDPGAK